MKYENIEQVQSICLEIDKLKSKLSKLEGNVCVTIKVDSIIVVNFESKFSETRSDATLFNDLIQNLKNLFQYEIDCLTHKLETL